MPVRDLNFGSLIHGVKGTRHVVIENLGEFDFKYSIYKIIQGVTDSKTLKKSKLAARPTSPGGTVRPPVKVAKNTDASNFGSFVVFPTSGVCQAGQKQQITVELHPENPGSYEESVAIDISERSPTEQDVLEYRLIGESRVPGINTVDFTSIFEEQTVCKRMELFNTQANAYAEEDRVFYFGAYLTGQVAYVRFKISNPFKVACDIQISTRPRSRTKSEATDFAFDVEPKKLNIQSHESKYVTVSFLPSTIQSYAGIFEAIVDNVADNKNKTLSFEIRGEGTLPRVSVDKPMLRTKTGIQVLKFAKSLLGKTQKLPIVIKNEGIITAKIKLEWIYKNSDEFECGGLNVVHVLKPLELKTFEVSYKPAQCGKFEADLKMKVMDNSFEDTSISIQGEGYLEDLTFDNIPNNTTGENEISFLECHVRKQKTLKFGITNHSSNTVRLAWGDTQDFTMSPDVMHIRPRSTKEVSMSFFSKVPSEVVKAPLSCKVSKITYTRPGSEFDWDDRQKSTAWISTEGF
jgi:hydrocephalus-inducing protein